ncbi:MAG: hypothetical protein IIY02_00375, partial [Firmicutes bacterium]|nr:hypothetical protein [Bacillota bacterium]
TGLYAAAEAAIVKLSGETVYYKTFASAYDAYSYTSKAPAYIKLLQEITQLTVGCLGCVIIIPATILIQSYIYSKGRPEWVLRSKTK